MPWPVFIEEEAGKLNYAALFFFLPHPQGMWNFTDQEWNLWPLE